MRTKLSKCFCPICVGVRGESGESPSASESSLWSQMVDSGSTDIQQWFLEHSQTNRLVVGIDEMGCSLHDREFLPFGDLCVWCSIFTDPRVLRNSFARFDHSVLLERFLESDEKPPVGYGNTACRVH